MGRLGASYGGVPVESQNHSSLAVRLFGQFEALLEGEPVPASAWGRRKTETLLKVLLTERGRVFSQDQLIELLYGGENPHKKFGNLRGRISELRRALEPHLDKGGNSRYILRIGEGYCFSSNAPCWLDTEAFQEGIRDAEQAQESGQWRLAVESYERAIELYRGEFLETDRYEEWSLASRESWQEEYLSALAQLAECHVQLGDCSRAITTCKQVLKIQPIREPAIRQLMRYYYVAGEDSRAVEAFEKGKQALKERLDVEPSSETTSLYEQIRQGELPRRTSALDPLRIAVLPFVNLCPNPEDEYFVDGMTEELIYSLSKVPELKVIAQTSVLSYKGTKKSIPQIGRELRVGTVVEGSVRKADSKLRITAQLINADSDEHIWAGKYDRDLDDVFAIQTEIAQQVTNVLRKQMLTKEASSPEIRYSGSTEVYGLYLEGRYFLKKRFKNSLQKARKSFEKALQIDDGFALAHAGLADAIWLLAHNGFIPTQAGYDMAEQEAKRTLAIDDTIGGAYATLGAIQTFDRFDPRGAEPYFRQAVELEPRNVQIRHWAACLFIILGRLDDAIDSYQQALDIDPVSVIANRSLGCAYYYARRYDDALRQLLKAERMETQDWNVHQYLGQVWLKKGQYERARAALEKSCEITTEGLQDQISIESVALFHVRELMGETGMLQQFIERIIGTEREASAIVSLGYFLLGDVDTGFEWLERSRIARDTWYLYLLQDPLLDSIKSNPRYREHLGKLGTSSKGHL